MTRGTVIGLTLVGVFLGGTPPLWGADAEAVKQAVTKGVKFLKGLQRPNGTWPNRLGATALAGLALLECGVAADDPAVQKAAAAVREESIGLTHTYSLSLAILFLDRLGDPRDVPFLESMTLKLLAGQSPGTGGWGYDCPAIAASEVSRLQTLLKQRNELTATQDLPKGRREVKDLPREVQAQLELINQQAIAPGAQGMAFGDNSNTQFATLALWVGRRQGLPVERALARVDARFRTTQQNDGGWSYGAKWGSSATMTCAGLLGLAVANGGANEGGVGKDPKAKGPKGEGKPRDAGNDRAIKKGLLALGTALAVPVGQPVRVGVDQDGNGKGYYFLWSMERVAMAYGLETIGNKDWYAWGADILLANQQPDGSWQAEYTTGGCDTSFALLFLKRANLAQDLTAMLKGKVSDPDQRELRTGGASGADLKSKPLGLNPVFGGGADKKPEPSGGDVRDRPPDGAGSEAARLGSDLVGGPDARQQEAALAKLRDTKGAPYTEALATAIPRLSGALKTKAREALADRLSRMTPATLAERLQDPDAEMRRAAALACAMKDDRTQVPKLIELLADKEATVVRAAHAALKALAGKGVDYGPAADATPAEQAKAVEAWKAWWNREKPK
jgi:hypothetical protein